MSFAATRLNLEIIILSKCNKDEYDVTLYVNLKKLCKGTYLQNRRKTQSHQKENNNLWLPKRKREQG